MKEKYSDESIEAYLLHRMTHQERQVFEHEIGANPELAKKVQQRGHEHKMMEVLVEDSLRAKMGRWQKEEVKLEEPARRILFTNRRIIIAIAAALLAILAALIWLNRYEKTELPTSGNQPEKVEQPVAQENQKELKGKEPAEKKHPANEKPEPPGDDKREAFIALAATFTEKMTYLEGTRSGNGEIEIAFNKALESLDKMQFSNGISYLKTIQESDTKYWWDAQYYLGLAYFEQENPRAAIPFLKKAAENNSYLYAEKAAWFLVLAYIQSGQIRSAEILINEMVLDTGHTYHQKASSLKEKLRKLK
jgi:tetratricopeptide (TPR) repeat protein